MEIKNSNGLIDMYIYGIKMAYNDIVLDYHWLKSHYKRIRRFYKSIYNHPIADKKGFYSSINFHFNRYDENLNYICSLIEKPTLNLDFMEITNKYFQEHNITLQSALKLYKMIITTITKEC